MGGMAIFGVVMWALIGSMEAKRLQGQLIQNNRLSDYMAFYAAGKLVREGRGADMYHLDAIAETQSDLLGVNIAGEDRLPYLNPPYVAAIFAPLTLTSLEAASAVMFTINVVLVVACAVILRRLVAAKDGRQAGFALLAWVSSFAVFTVFLQLQFSLFCLLAWLGFVHFQIQGQQRWSGASLVLGLFKPQLILLPVLYLCYRRQFAALVPLAAVGAVLALLSVAVAGPGVLIDYPRFLMQSTSWEGQGIYAHGMYGWNSLVADVTGDATPPSLLTAFLVVPTFALTFAAWWLARDAHGRDLLPLLGMTVTAALLTNLHLYLHDVVLLALALALGAAHALARGDSATNWAAITVAFWFLMLPLPGMQTVPGGLPFLTVAMAALFVHFWLEVKRCTAATAVQPSATRSLAA
jgi:hypothetical protein